jgi:triacylglycerol esterase/lipase EstA (alpha/beta hydrolase family)
MRRRAVVLLLVVAAAWAAAPRAALAATGPAAEPSTPAAAPPSLPGSPVCGPSPASPTEPQNGRNDTGTRDASPIYFAPDFPVVADTDPNTTLGAVGGFGGIGFRAPLHHTPVIFVHGNQADAQNWLDVMQQFAQLAGYTMQEMYALSFNGLGNYYAGAPEQTPPTQLDQDYITQNSNVLANGGHGAGDDDNLPDLCHFVEAVQWYTGSRQVDIVAHSLGVTITRRLMELYPSLAPDVTAFVGIAGGNHGTSVCTGLASSYYGCDEIAPGTQWLAQLNAYGETYGRTHWMTVYNGADGDPFFGPTLEQSPALAGADNETFNANTTGAPTGRGDYHNDLRVDPPEVETYLAFLLREGQQGPGAAGGVDGLAASIAADGQARRAANQQAPQSYTQITGTLCIPGLTGTQDGCTLPGGAGPNAGSAPTSGSRGNQPPPAATGTLPNSSALASAGAPSLAAVGLALAGAATGRRRIRRRDRGQRIPVS